MPINQDIAPRLAILDGESYDVCNSPDDGGWYLQRHRDNFVSDEIYPTERSAREALDSGLVDWRPS